MFFEELFQRVNDYLKHELWDKWSFGGYLDGYFLEWAERTVKNDAIHFTILL